MRKAIALLAALVALPSFGAVDTTTISGKVLTPSGDPATAGKVTCELSQAASASDGSGVQRVATRVSATIGATGAVSIALAPNDTMTPAGTYYTCKFTVTTPASASWVEKWSVASAPDPVDIGSVSRLDVAPGTTTGVYVVALATCAGACPSGGVCIDKDDNSQYFCSSGTWSRYDLPHCAADPPVTSCAFGAVCQSTVDGFSLYGCNAGTWSQVTGDGTGSSSSISVDDVLTANANFVDAGDINFADIGSGRITGTVQADKVALTTDTTGDYVSGAATGGGLVKVGTEAATLGLLTTCGSTQILKWNGSAWACAADDTSAGGTVSITPTPAENQIGIWSSASAMKGAPQLTWDATNNKLVATNQITGTAQYATDLSADGTNCSAGNYPLGVDSKGSVQSCTADDDTPDNDGEVPDAITVSSSGSVAWTALTSYPAACSAGQYVSTIGDTLTCGTPSAGSVNVTGTPADNYVAVFTNANTVEGKSDLTFDGTTLSVPTLTTTTACTSDCGATLTDNTAEPSAPASGKTLLYSQGGQVYKKDSGDSTNDRLLLDSGVVTGDVTFDNTGVATIAADAVGAAELAATAVVAGSYTSTNLTVDADGRITAAANGSGSSNPWASVSWFEDFISPGEVDPAGSGTSCNLVGAREGSGASAGIGGGLLDSTTLDSGYIGSCYVGNGTTTGEGIAIGFGQASKDMDQDVMAWTKLREFRIAFYTSGSAFATATTRNAVIAIGGVSQGTSSVNTVDYAALDNGIFFLCAPHLDIDDDSTADDATEDNNWYLVVSNDTDGTMDFCYQDGAGGCTPDSDITWFDTGIDCVGSGRNSKYYEAKITWAGSGSIAAYLDDDGDPSTWTWTATASNCTAGGSACLTSDLPSTGYVSLWGYYIANGTTSAALNVSLDYIYYSGVR